MKFKGPVSGFVGGRDSTPSTFLAPIINAAPSLIASQPVVLGSCLLSISTIQSTAAARRHVAVWARLFVRKARPALGL